MQSPIATINKLSPWTAAAAATDETAEVVPQVVLGAATPKKAAPQEPPTEKLTKANPRVPANDSAVAETETVERDKESTATAGGRNSGGNPANEDDDCLVLGFDNDVERNSAAFSESVTSSSYLHSFAWSEAMHSEWSSPSEKIVCCTRTPATSTALHRDGAPPISARNTQQTRMFSSSANVDVTQASSVAPAWGRGEDEQGSRRGGVSGCASEEVVRWGRVDLLSILHPSPRNGERDGR